MKSLRCPLCLESLEGDAVLVFFCSEHPGHTGRVEVGQDSPDAVLAKLQCAERRCSASRGLTLPGILVAHASCPKGPSPVPRPEKLGFPIFVKGLTKDDPSLELKHWEAQLFKRLSSGAGSPLGVASGSMFFPLSLLRANHLSRGVTVELSGAKGVGKTLLAMQALDAQGYEGPLSDGLGQLAADFIYCTPEGLGATYEGETFLRTLCMRDLMRNNAAFDAWLRATPDRPRDLKTAFFLQGGTGTAGRTETKSGLLGYVTGLFRLLVERAAGGSRSPSPRAVSFFDSAGEASVPQASENLRDTGTRVDVLAVLVAMDHILSDPRELSTAVNRLNAIKRLTTGDSRMALVVTKADVAWKEEPEELEALRHADRSADGARLVKVLRGIPPENYHASRGELLDLLSDRKPPDLLSDQKPLVDNTFFVWHETRGTWRQSYGLGEFVSWCLLERRPSRPKRG